MLDGLRSRAVDLGYATGWGAVKAVPEPLARQAFQRVADAATVRNGKGAQQLRRNLRRVVPDASEGELDELVGAGLRSYSRYWMETFRLPRLDPHEVAVRAEQDTHGIEHIDAARAAGSGYVLALPHSGNWDVAGIWLVDHTGETFTTVAERLKPESLFDRFVAYREGLGFEIVALTGGERPPMAALTDRLRAGGCVCLMADRDLSRHGVEVELFGEATRFPAGPALLAAQTGAALLPVTVWYTPTGWGQRILPPVELVGTRLKDRVTSGVQALATAFEGMIREHPADWHMLQKLWLADLTPRP